MARSFQTQVLLPDGRHLDWRLMARIEKELKARLERWESSDRSLGHGYRVTVAFTNGKLEADDVAEARRHVREEPDDVEYVGLVAWAQPEPMRRCFVFLYPEADREVLRRQDRSRVDIEGTDRTEIYGLAEVIRQYTEAPPGDLPDAPQRVIDGGNPWSTYADEPPPEPSPPWWREHVNGLAVTILGTVIAGLILYALIGSA